MGRVAVEWEGVTVDEQIPGRQGRLLFAHLVHAQGKPVHRDQLAETLWDDAPPPSWESALRALVSKLRKVLIDHVSLEATAGGYRLELPPRTWVDIFAAEKAAKEADDLLADGKLEDAIAAGKLAESFLRETFMPGDDGVWVETKRRDLQGVQAQAINAVAEASLRSGKPESSLTWARRAVEMEPFRESSYRRLMEAHVAAGNRAEALRVYEQCRLLLAEELGAYPSPETEAIYRRLLDRPEVTDDLGSDAPMAAADASPTGPSSNGRRKKIGLTVGVVAIAITIAGIVVGFLFVDQGGSAPAALPNSLVRVNPTTLKVTEVAAVGDAPDLVLASGGYLWITNHILRGGSTPGAPRDAGDRTLIRLDPGTGKWVPVSGGLAPCGLAKDPSGDVWIANCYPVGHGLHDDVVRVDAKNLLFKERIPAPGGDGFYRGVAYGGGSLWLSQIVGGNKTNPDEVTQINPETKAHRTIHLSRAASGLAWSGSYGDLWINNFDDGSLTRLQPSTGLTEPVSRVATNPAFPVVDGNVVWVGDWVDGQVVRINAVGPPRPRRIPLPGDTSGVWNIAVGARAIWATSPQDGALWRINPKTGHAVRISIPGRPTGVAADANNVWVTVRSP